MIKKKFRFFPLLLFSLGFIDVQAQKTIAVTGGDAKGSGGSASYSVGQIDYISAKAVSGSVNEGVQHPLISTSLPVTALNLSAFIHGDKVIVKWQTAAEINSSNFIVQRSKDGLTFSNLKEIPAAGNSSIEKRYSAEDPNPLAGKGFYRIKQIDMDGRFTYSNVVSVSFTSSENIAVVYPNPARENITLKVATFSGHSLSYSLYNVKGELIKTNKIVNNLTLIELKELPSSNYLLKIIDNNKEIKTFKIIKTK